MATISASTGQILGDDGNPAVGGGTQSPYTIFANNLTSMLQTAQKTASQGNAALQSQIGGLQRGEAALGQPGPGNPLAFMYNMASPSALSQEQGQMSKIFEPGITSIQGQEQLANENLSGINTTANTEINAFNAMKPSWTLSPTPNENGEFYFYNTNVAPGQPPQQYLAGKVPPDVAGSPGGSPASANSPQTLAQSHNPYGIKMSDTTSKLYTDLGATPGPAANDGGHFWSFPDDTTGEKAARTLLTSSLYANDTVDQALRQWSNYTGTGPYPGYNSEILKGTGIDPNATIKTLGGPQIDTILAAMKKAESVGTPASAVGGNLISKAVAQVLSGGIGFDDQFNSLNGLYGGKLTKSQFLSAIQKVKPDFNVNQSNAVAAGQGANTELAASTSALVDKTNQTLDLLPDKFDKLPWLMQQGGDMSGNAGFGLAESTGLGKTEVDDYKRTLAEARASANQVLTTAANLGVVTGGKTADTLLPDNMSKAGLAQAITTIKQLEEQTKTALAKLSNSNVAGQQAAGATDIAALRAKYNY